MTFVFDLDDTLCETDKYSEFYILKFFKENNLPYKQIAKDARFAEMKFDWSKEEALKWYKKYGDEMFLHFPCKKKTRQIINNLHKQGHRIVIATARSTDWHVNPEEMTLQWLKNKGICYDKIYFGRIDKENICREENADVFVDDDINTVIKVQKYFDTLKDKKRIACLAATKYNKTLQIDDDIFTIDSLEEIVNNLDKKSNL